jgi:hypothetical protein
MKQTACLFFLLAALASTGAADPVSFTLQNSTLSTAAGGSVTFIATALNTAGFLENLNADSFTIDAPLTLDDTPFETNWPFTLDVDQSFGPEALFSVMVPLGTAAANYSGTFDLLGGAGGSDMNLLSTAPFTVTVTNVATVPEPAALSMLGAACILLACSRRLRNA